MIAITGKEKDRWLSERMWCLSGNRVLESTSEADQQGVTGRRSSDSPVVATQCQRLYRPQSTQEISDILRTFPSSPVACVCGGHESSNVAAFASPDAIVLDLIHLKSINFDDAAMEVTVGAGVVFQELVESVKDHHGALPVGTGPTVGVVGFLVNGGLSGYFTRRMGMLGQLVTKMTIVTPAGEIRTLTPADGDLFTCMLGAGSALAIVVDVTLHVEPESAVQCAEQRVIAYQSREQAVAFTRQALNIMNDLVLPNPSVSMELVVSGTNALVTTFVFYDTFQGNTTDYTSRVTDLAASCDLPILAESHWSTWYEAAAALWPVIAGMKGNPLVTLQHCVGTRSTPSDSILDFVADTIVGQAPSDDANLSLVEIRTLGGAAQSGRELPSGICHHQFFAGIITLYDAKDKSSEERQRITLGTNHVVQKAREVNGLTVDFSGTTSQPDDLDYAVAASDMFGTVEMADTVQSLKVHMDPLNRLRFHPFAKLLGDARDTVAKE